MWHNAWQVDVVGRDPSVKYLTRVGKQYYHRTPVPPPSPQEHVLM